MPGGGIVLTNLPPLPGLDYASLKAKRDDVILLRLIGNRDGSAAVDYTVNAASGFPLVTGNNTGSGGGALPVNHVLPAWDIAAGLYLATALLAAERHRARTGEGQEVVGGAQRRDARDGRAISAMSATSTSTARARPAIGNDLYGSFGRDFATADGRRVMIIALTPRQWRAIGRATGLADKLAMVGADDGGRSRHRDRPLRGARRDRGAAGALVRQAGPWPKSRDAFAGSGVLWGPFQDFVELVRDDPRCSPQNPLFAEVDQPGIGRYPMPGLPLDFSRRAAPADPPGAAPRRAHRTGPLRGAAAFRPARSPGCATPASPPDR